MTVAVVLFALALLAVHLCSIGLVLWRRGRRSVPDPAVGLPFIAVLRPVCGLDPFDAETLGSGFGLDYPSYEVIFCCADPDDPVIPLVRGLIAANPGTPARLLIGEQAISGNPKLNNLAKGWAATGADWIVMTDSNVLLPRDYLHQLMAAWDRGTGMVSSPPVGLRPQGLWGALECTFLNGHQARWQLAADALGLGFAQGKTLFTTRALVEQAGGLAALGRDLAEDVGSTKMVRAAGLRVRLVAQPFAQPIGQRSLAAVWGRQLRWSRVRWHGFPGLFLIEPLSGPALPVLGLGAATIWGGLPWAAMALFVALWYGSEWALLRAMGWPGGPRDLAASVLRDAMLPVLWAATFAARGFVWRGTAMTPGSRSAAE
jgi:ceramide glucosyltransferase